MPSLSSFIRKTSAELVKSLVIFRLPHLEKEINWTASARDISLGISQGISGPTAEETARFLADTDRIGLMADEAGGAAFFSVAMDDTVLNELPSYWDRSTWMFLKEPGLFQHAEEARFTDEKRRMRSWYGFSTTPNLSINSDPHSVESFRIELKQIFSADHAIIDVFERKRPAMAGESRRLIHITIYSEGRPDSALEFEKDEVVRRMRRPAIEACVTYEPATGEVEIVGSNQSRRADVAKSFVKEMLGGAIIGQALSKRKFDLNVLKSPFAFPTDREDGIASVEVRLLRLMPIDSEGDRVTLERVGGGARTLWSMADSRFGAHNPLDRGWVITMVRLVVKFHPEAGARRGKTMPVTITMPHGCDLKDQTNKEQVIGEKYLRRWGLLTDEPILFES